MKRFFTLIVFTFFVIGCEKPEDPSGLTVDQREIFNRLTNNGTNLPDGNTLSEEINNGPTSPTPGCDSYHESSDEEGHPMPAGHEDLINKNDLSERCNIVFVRHAERPAGVDRCLTSKGRSQAKVLKSYLEGITSRDGALEGDFDVHFKSKYKRVHHTLAFYQDFLNIKGTKMVTNPNGSEDGDHFRESSKPRETRRNVRKAKEKILKECSKKKEDGRPVNILVGGHGTHGKALLRELMGSSLGEYPHHAEPYILALKPGSDSKFERVRPARPLQKIRTTSNPRVSCDSSY